MTNPRQDHWGDHFILAGMVIEPRTPIAESTANILGFNGIERILERQALVESGRYPVVEAKSLMFRRDA